MFLYRTQFNYIGIPSLLIDVKFDFQESKYNILRKMKRGVFVGKAQ